MEKFHKHIYQANIGSAPFVFGDLKDYWPEMPDKYMDYDKTKYLSERQPPIMIKLADAEKERQTRLEEHITFLFQGERTATKLLIHTAVNDMKEKIMQETSSSSKGGGGGYRGRGGGGNKDSSARGGQQ